MNLLFSYLKFAKYSEEHASFSRRGQSGLIVNIGLLLPIYDRPTWMFACYLIKTAKII